MLEIFAAYIWLSIYSFNPQLTNTLILNIIIIIDAIDKEFSTIEA
jgi:hypothetical protein